MRIAKRGSGLTAFAALGWVAAPAAAKPMLIPCSHCLIPSPVMAAKPVRDRLGAASPHPLLAYDFSFHSEPAATGGVTDHFVARLFGSVHDGFAIETSRRFVKRAYSLDRTGGTREKLSSGAVLLHYDGHVGGDDILSLGLGGSYEKRRFALDLSNGHMVRSRSVGIEGAWNHGAYWRLSGGYRDDRAGNSGSPLTRSIELTEGAGRTQRGPWMAIGFTPGGPTAEHPLALGVRMQAMRLSDGDRLALGAASAHDSRIALTMSMRFR